MITPFALSILLLITEKNEHFLVTLEVLYSSTSSIPRKFFSLRGVVWDEDTLLSFPGQVSYFKLLSINITPQETKNRYCGLVQANIRRLPPLYRYRLIRWLITGCFQVYAQKERCQAKMNSLWRGFGENLWKTEKTIDIITILFFIVNQIEVTHRLFWVPETAKNRVKITPRRRGRKRRLK